jgi:hypothetical protein
MDFLAHLVDAPVANILIFAGLAFLGIAVIGKISGKIEPSTSGRLMSGVVGIALLVYGINAHSNADGRADRGKPDEKRTAAGSTSQPGQEREEQQPRNRFEGKWNNDNSQARGLTRLEIEQQGKTVKVHAWASCTPQDCDWGTESGVIDAGTASVAWDQNFVLRKMTLTHDAGRLRMVLDSVFRDNRAPQHAVEYFVRRQ